MALRGRRELEAEDAAVGRRRDVCGGGGLGASVGCECGIAGEHEQVEVWGVRGGGAGPQAEMEEICGGDVLGGKSRGAKEEK